MNRLIKYMIAQENWYIANRLNVPIAWVKTAASIAGSKDITEIYKCLIQVLDERIQSHTEEFERWNFAKHLIEKELSKQAGQVLVLRRNFKELGTHDQTYSKTD